MDQTKQTRTRLITFKVLNVILIVGMLGGGLAQVTGAEQQVQFFMQFGFPLYFMPMIGIAKIIAAVVLMLPRVPLLKVAAYTGSFIVTTNAVILHLYHGDVLFAISPLIVSALSVAVCLLNPNISFAKPRVSTRP
jgi:hypothetical protein